MAERNTELWIKLVETLHDELEGKTVRVRQSLSRNRSRDHDGYVTAALSFTLDVDFVGC